MPLHDLLKARVDEGRKLLVAYLCAGFPSAAETLPLLEAAAEGGADAIELGVPFSDPLLDGPVIQAAAQRALVDGMTLSGVLEIAGRFTARNRTPLLLMSSFNPILRMGPDTFARKAREAGVSGCILPDLPPEAQHLMPDAPPLVQFVAPNTPADRVEALARRKPPFLYGVAVFGVTGARSGLADYTLPFLRRVKAGTDIPLLAGFGVSSPDQARTMAEVCDGVIVGSALLRALEPAADGPRAMREFLAPLRAALDGIPARA